MFDPTTQIQHLKLDSGEVINNSRTCFYFNNFHKKINNLLKFLSS